MERRYKFVGGPLDGQTVVEETNPIGEALPFPPVLSRGGSLYEYGENNGKEFVMHYRGEDIPCA